MQIFHNPISIAAYHPRNQKNLMAGGVDASERSLVSDGLPLCYWEKTNFAFMNNSNQLTDCVYHAQAN